MHVPAPEPALSVPAVLPALTRQRFENVPPLPAADVLSRLAMPTFDSVHGVSARAALPPVLSVRPRDVVPPVPASAVLSGQILPASDRNLANTIVLANDAHSSVRALLLAQARAAARCKANAYDAIELAEQNQCDIWCSAPDHHDKVISFVHLKLFTNDGSADVWANYPSGKITPICPFDNQIIGMRLKAAADAAAAQAALHRHTHVSVEPMIARGVDRSVPISALNSAAENVPENVAHNALVSLVLTPLVHAVPANAIMQPSVSHDRVGIQLAKY